MHPLFHRLGFLKLSRGAALLLVLVAAAVGAAFWIGPFRPLPARIVLQVSNATLSAPQTIRLASSRGTSGHARFPLILAASNTGARAALPTALNLSVPNTYRLVRGIHPLAADVTPGNPLVRYTIDVAGIALPADSTVYSILDDTVWIEPNIADYDCTLTDSVPDFVPPPPRSAASLARMPVFYSFEGAPERQTGMFTAMLDSSALHIPVTAMPPTFPTYTREPEAPRPELGPIHRVGTRTSWCGDPQDPIELYTVDWETDAGGRFLVVYVNGAPRKQMYDLDRDSIIELEMWDPNRDGRFEAWREARFAVPAILLPERLPIEALPNDSLMNDPQWMNTFNDTLTGPFRFLSDSARARRIRPIADTAVMHVDSAGGEVRTVIDTAWVRKFNDAAAGPYRFLQNPPARRFAVPPVDTVTRAPPRRAAPPPRRPTGAQLGRPVPMPPLNTGGN